MCGRYFIEESPEFEPIAEAMNRSPLLHRFSGAPVTRGEVRPTCVVPVVASDRRGQRAVFPMQWGFQAKSLLINARVESAAERPAFRDAWRAHRCVVPATFYYEWDHRLTPGGRNTVGDKYRLRPAGADLVWLAGLYRLEEGLPRFVILTRAPAERIRFIHDRMPLMLPASAAEQWIRPDQSPEPLLKEAQTDIDFERDA